MSKSHPIILLTDFGTKDSYVGMMKSVIFTLFPSASVIDLTHGVEPQNLKQASFILESAYPYFPPGSISVTVVDPGVGSQRRIIAARTKDLIFLAPDNGILARILEREKHYELRAVTNKEFFLKRVSSTFHGRDCFAPTAARLARNPTLFSSLGPRIKSLNQLHFPEAGLVKGKIVGEIVFFDHFGNAFTNISRKDLEASRLRNPHIKVGGKPLGPIRNSYYEVARGKATALFSSSDWLEIAVNQGSALAKLRLKEGTKIEVA